MMRLRKRGLICKFLLLSILLLAIYPAKVKVFAADYMGSVTLTTDSTTIYPGDEFIINVSVKVFGFEGINLFTAKKEYDTSAVQYLGAIASGNWNIQSDTDSFDDATNSNGTIKMKDTSGYHNEEVIVQLKFKALDTTGAEGINIILKYIEADGAIGWISYENKSASDAIINIKIVDPPEPTEPPELIPFSCKIDYENRRLLIDKGTNTMFFLSVIDAKGNVKPYEIFEAHSDVIKIDLSSYSTAKEWNFLFYGDVDQTPISLNLVPAIKGLKAKYDPLGYSVDDRIIVTVEEDELSIDELEVRTLGGKWEDAADLTEEQLDTYAVTGATLVFRIKAIEDESPYSSEAKVKVPKKAAGPKVTMDYSKLTIKFAKNSEYRLRHTDIWRTSPIGTVKLEALTDIKTENFYLEIRTAETETKPTSKYVITNVAAQIAGPTIGEGEAEIKIINTNAGGVTTAVSIKNTSEALDVEYAFVNSSVNIDTIDLTKQKWKKLLKSSEVVLKKAESDGKVIIVRYAAITTKNVTPQFASKIGKSDVIVWAK